MKVRIKGAFVSLVVSYNIDENLVVFVISNVFHK
jgi:hypothetical protein